MSRLSHPRSARLAVLVAGAVALAAASGIAATAANAAGRPGFPSPSHSTTASPLPRNEDVPKPDAVTLDPATTAYLVLDDSNAVCAPNPACVATEPAAARFAARARAAGALVVYSITVDAGDAVVPRLAPHPGDPMVEAKADKFFGTDLDAVLQAHGIKTVVIVGTKTNGAVLYTAYEANIRGYTAVVAEDGTSSDTAFIQRFSLFQLLDAPGATNLANTPLAPDATTLSTTRLIRFAPAN